MYSRKVASQLKELETPFYLYDINLLRQTLNSVVSESKKIQLQGPLRDKGPPSPPSPLETPRARVGFGSASPSERQGKTRIPTPRQQHNSVWRWERDKEIRYAIEQNILALNCESIEELQVINAIAAEMGRRVDVGLRVNPDIDPKTNHCIDTGQADSKFGIAYDEILENTELIKSLENINIIGLHLHIGSQIRELHVFENMCNKVNAIVEKLRSHGFSFRMVDVGGGLGINYDVPENEPIPNFASLFSIVHEYLNVGDCEVHFEFGRSIVGECGELITRVLFNKTTATGRRLLIVDASMTEFIRPMLYGAYHNIENITSQDETRMKYTVVGTACESTDVFDENVSLRKSQRGDLLSIKSSGAYGRSMASQYNLHDLPAAVYSDSLPFK